METHIEDRALHQPALHGRLKNMNSAGSYCTFLSRWINWSLKRPVFQKISTWHQHIRWTSQGRGEKWRASQLWKEYDFIVGIYSYRSGNFQYDKSKIKETKPWRLFLVKFGDRYNLQIPKYVLRVTKVAENREKWCMKWRDKAWGRVRWQLCQKAPTLQGDGYILSTEIISFVYYSGCGNWVNQRCEQRRSQKGFGRENQRMGAS